MSSVDSAPARGLLQRLDFIYFALAAFDLVTICVALFLGHLTVTAFEDGVRTSAVWSQRQADIIHLSRLAQVVDAPGNDIFYSRDANTERRRFESALTAFNAGRSRISRQINDATLSSRDADIARRLGGIQATMDRMATETATIFHEFQRGREERASRSMAVMDRTFAILGNQLDETLAIVEAGRAEHLEAQLARARLLRGLELFVGAAVLLIVGLVATYGAHMGRTLRANEAQRQRMLADLATAHERLQHYADDVSHELRGPISKMRLDAEVLLRVDRSQGQYRAGVESMLIECQRLSAIVESLLFLARAENAAAVISKSALDLKKELGLIAEFFAAAAEDAGVQLRVGSASGALLADRSLLQRAVSNLISNALAHTPNGGVIELSAGAVDHECWVEVKDDGPGVSPEMLPRVFDRFQRGGSARSDNGLGLGLAITKSIMQLHGGTIAIDSEAGAGVRARLIFPRN